MKKLFSSLLIVAASLALASCVKEQVPAPDPAQGGEPVNVSFSLRLGDALTKAAPEASAFDSASGEFKLYVAVFSKSNGSLISTSRIGGTGFQPVETITSEKSSVVMTLSRSQDYKVVFFAMRDGAYTVNFADNNVAAFSFKSGLKANDASLDAFYATVDVASSTKAYDVTLRRPFAQLNVLVPQDNVPKGQTAFSSAMSVTAPASFDLFAGAAVDTDMKTIAFADNAIAAEAVGAYKGTHRWIGMNFVLVPKSGNVSIASFKESGMSESVQIGAVPAKVNGRTNMVGRIYSLSDYVFNLEVNPEFGDEQEQDLGEEDTPGDDTPGDDTPEDTEISVVDGKTFTTENPLVITAAQSVKLRVNGDDIATVEKGANGAKVTAKSADETIAKAAVANNDVVITPVANGKTTVTINTPAYTKASYAAQTLVLPVKVDGMGGNEPGGEETGDVKKVTVAEFNAAAPSATQKYQLTGKISGTINDTYGNFDLVDESGTVYVYGLTATEQALTVNEDGSFKANNDKSYSSLGLKAGDVVTIIGYRAVHNDKVEVLGAYYVSHEAGETPGDDTPGGDTPGGEAGDVKKVTVAEFNAATPSATQKYQLTGKISGTINDTYGNFDLVDESGTVYVYGLTATEQALTVNEDGSFKANNDKSYSSLGLKAGDVVTIIGYRAVHNDKVEVLGAYYVSHEAGQGSGTEPGSGTVVEGNTETITFSAFNYANAADLTTVSGQNVTLTFAGGTNTKNAPKYYTAGTAARMYGGNVLTISSESTITKVEFTFAPDYTDQKTGTVSNYQATAACFADGTFANDVWTGSTNSLVLTNNKEDNAQVRIVSLKITFD